MVLTEKLLCSAVCLAEDQVVAAILRILVQCVRAVVDRTEHSRYVDGVIQCMENIEAGEILQLLIIGEFRRGRLLFGSFFCRIVILTGRMLFRFRNPADQSEHIIRALDLILQIRECGVG